ncbi:major facilitator superfamily domain-containing protein [Irpex lacteus]|nr:major facilitator superfamily domain-containing protein [Irpex lacteus]
MSEVETYDISRPGTAGSDATHTPVCAPIAKLKGGEGESAIPEDQKEDLVENAEDDWTHDPRNPRNWPARKKWTMTAIYLLLTFAFGPLFLAPLSEIYGRTWILHIGNLLFLVFNLVCAYAPNTGVLLGMRLICGFVGSAPIACGGGTISDLFSERDRASAMAIYSLGPLIGPAVGPIAGGFITETVGFKWVFIVISVLCGIASIIGIPLLRETYGPVIRLRLAKHSADPEKAAKAHPHLMQNHGNGPFILLTRSLVCFVLSLYMAFMYGIYYLMFTTFPELFSVTYGFSPGIEGLCYIGLAWIPSVADKVYHALSVRNGGKGKPEFRVPALIFGSFFVPAKIHWIMPSSGQLHLYVHLFSDHSNSVYLHLTTTLQVFRSMLGFAFPLFGSQMYAALGNGGGNSLLAGLAIVLGIPFPVWLWYKGEEVRQRSSLSRS